jgi:hypothetical protein
MKRQICDKYCHKKGARTDNICQFWHGLGIGVYIKEIRTDPSTYLGKTVILNYKLLYRWITSVDETQMLLTAAMASNAPKRSSERVTLFCWFPAV